MNGSAGAADTGRISDALRERTAELHLKAERSGVIADILRRKADRRGYALLLRNLLPAYQVMEAALAGATDRPLTRAFADPALHRSASLIADLEAIIGRDWRENLPLLPAGERYAQRVAAVGADTGPRLAAHAYVRYFGDLSGGQILKRMLGQTLALPPEALSFYEFPGIADVGAFKDRMRADLDADAADVGDHEAIIDEGMRAFEHNIEVSDAIKALSVQPA